jgi:hypothetical protein
VKLAEDGDHFEAKKPHHASTGAKKYEQKWRAAAGAGPATVPGFLQGEGPGKTANTLPQQ